MKEKKINLLSFSKFISDKIQELIIFPTERCNFRCTYCYENHSNIDMNQKTILGIKNLIKNRALQLEKLYILWFGGEPLVAEDIVINISSYANCLSKKYNFEFIGSMTTNGYNLVPSLFSQLTTVGVRQYQISLDGPEKIHNLSRKLKNGQGTYKRIWDNLLYIRDSNQPVSVTLRIHVDSDKIQYIDFLIKEIRKEFLNDSRFKFLIKPLQRLGGENDAKIKVLSLDEEQFVIDDLYRKLSHDQVIESRTTMKACYASAPNSLVVFTNGKIGKCTVALNDSRNIIGQLYSDGTIEIIQSKLIPWIRGLSTLNKDSLECPLINM